MKSEPGRSTVIISAAGVPGWGFSSGGGPAGRAGRGDTAFAASCGSDNQCGRARRRSPEKITAIDGTSLRLSHRVTPSGYVREITPELRFPHHRLRWKNQHRHFPARCRTRCSATQSRNRSMRARSRHIRLKNFPAVRSAASVPEKSLHAPLNVRRFPRASSGGLWR